MPAAAPSAFWTLWRPGTPSEARIVAPPDRATAKFVRPFSTVISSARQPPLGSRPYSTTLAPGAPASLPLASSRRTPASSEQATSAPAVCAANSTTKPRS